MVRMRDAIEGLQDPGRSTELAAVRRVLAFRLKAAAAAHRTALDVENVEELFSLASAMGGSSSSDMIWAICATLDYCDSFPESESEICLSRALFSENAIDRWPRTEESLRKSAERARDVGCFRVCESDVNVAAMLGLLSPTAARSIAVENSLISFNYDLVVENAVKKLGLKLSYELPGALTDNATSYVDSAAKLRLYKMHGSMNWVPGDRPNTLHILENYEQARAAQRAPLLVPPTWRKDFTQHLSSVWDGAVDAIRRATRIVVLGFSLPPTDIHFRYLLAAGLRDNISLRKIVFVNDDPAIESRVVEVLRPELVTQGVLDASWGTIKSYFRGLSARIGRETEFN